MRAVIQRVTSASVEIDNVVKSAIHHGLLILLATCEDDSEDDIEWLANKIVNLRIMDDENGVMNKSVLDTDGELLIVSQFTLWASYKKGNRPSFLRAGNPAVTKPLYERFCNACTAKLGRLVGTGEFGAEMEVSLVNDGPVTICIDTKNKE